MNTFKQGVEPRHGAAKYTTVDNKKHLLCDQLSRLPIRANL